MALLLPFKSEGRTLVCSNLDHNYYKSDLSPTRKRFVIRVFDRSTSIFIRYNDTLVARTMTMLNRSFIVHLDFALDMLYFRHWPGVLTYCILLYLHCIIVLYCLVFYCSIFICAAKWLCPCKHAPLITVRHLRTDPEKTLERSCNAHFPPNSFDRHLQLEFQRRWHLQWYPVQHDSPGRVDLCWHQSSHRPHRKSLAVFLQIDNEFIGIRRFQYFHRNTKK